MFKGFNCPRTQHNMTLELCAGRKVRKQHGCGTCTYPRQVERDFKVIEGLKVRLDFAPKPKYMPVVIEGLSPAPIRMSKRVARDLLKKLQAAVA